MQKSSVKESVGLILSMVLIGVLLLYIVFQLFMPNTTIKVFGFKPYRVVTNSMEPEINVNDIVVDRQFHLEDAKKGDIITFSADIDYNGSKEIVTHYIYSITTSNDQTIIRTNRYYSDITQAVPDTWLLTPDDVIGAYWFQIPKVGYVTEFIKSPFGIATVIVNAGIIVGIVYLIKKENPQVEESHTENNKEK